MRKMQPPPQRVRLSVEEEAILIDDQHQAMGAIDADDHEIDRLVDTEAGLNATIQIVDMAPEFNNVDRGLVHCVADVAVAGTDADPEQVIDADEAGLSTEDFIADATERLKKIWAKIREFLVTTWKRIMEFLTGEKRKLESTKSEAEDVEKFIEEHKTILMLEYDPAFAERAAAAAAAAAEKRARDEEEVRKSDEESRAKLKARQEKALADEEESRAKLKARQEKALAELKTAIANHTFKPTMFDAGLVSVMGGNVPKDLGKHIVDLSTYAQQAHKRVGQTLRELCHAFDDVLTKFDSEKPEAAISLFTERFHKDMEVLGRAIGEMTNNDGLLRAHTKGYMLGHFDVEITDQQPTGNSTLVENLTRVSRAGLKVSHNADKKPDTVPMLPELIEPVVTANIKRWVEGQLGHDAAGLENTLHDYGTKFLDRIDRLVNVQQSVKGVADDNNSYHVIQGLINVCRGLDKMIMEFNARFTSSVHDIMRAVLRYQHQANQERVRLYKEAMGNS